MDQYKGTRNDGCWNCRHLDRNSNIRCAAYPQHIPLPIQAGEVEHKEPLPEDLGIQWEALPSEDSGPTKQRWRASAVATLLGVRVKHLPGQHDQMTHGRGGSAVGEAFASMPLDKATSGAAKKWRKANQEKYDTDPEFKAVADLATIYTQGGFRSIREWQQAESEGVFPDAAGGSSVPTWGDKPISHLASPMSDYKNYFTGQDVRASDVMTVKEAAGAMNRAIAGSPPLQQPIFRGAHAHYRRDIPLGEPPRLTIEPPAVGERMRIAGSSSFTADGDTARAFAEGTAKGQPKLAREPVATYVYEIAPGARGLPVAALSPYAQQEVITRGNFRVREVRQNTTQLYTRYGSMDQQNYHVVLEQEDAD